MVSIVQIRMAHQTLACDTKLLPRAVPHPAIPHPQASAASSPWERKLVSGFFMTASLRSHALLHCMQGADDVWVLTIKYRSGTEAGPAKSKSRGSLPNDWNPHWRRVVIHRTTITRDGVGRGRIPAQ